MILSIVIPVLNDLENYLALFRELRRQIDDLDVVIRSNVEILGIDDGSTDEMKNLANVYHLKGNNGVSYARNYGAAKADGDYIAFIDSDDFICSGYIKTIVDTITVNGGDKAMYWFKARTQDGFEQWHKNPVWAKAYRKDVFKKIKFREDLFAGEDICFNTEFDERFGEDYTKIDKVIYQYRWSANANSLSKRYNRGEFNGRV